MQFNIFNLKLKYGVESFVTTIDPQMKDYIRKLILIVFFIFFFILKIIIFKLLRSRQQTNLFGKFDDESKVSAHH